MHKNTLSVAAADQRCDKTMYHATNRLVAYVTKEINDHKDAIYFLVIGSQSYQLVSHPPRQDGPLAHILLIHWESLHSKTTRFYCLKPDTQCGEVVVNKTLGFSQALGAPALYRNDE